MANDYLLGDGSSHAIIHWPGWPVRAKRLPVLLNVPHNLRALPYPCYPPAALRPPLRSSHTCRGVTRLWCDFAPTPPPLQQPLPPASSLEWKKEDWAGIRPWQALPTYKPPKVTFEGNAHESPPDCWHGNDSDPRWKKAFMEFISNSLIPGILKPPPKNPELLSKVKAEIFCGGVRWVRCVVFG